MRTIKLKVFTIIVTHKHGEDVYLTKDEPTQIQLEEIRKWFSKAYEVDAAVDLAYGQNVTDLPSSNEIIHRLKNIC